MNWKFWRMNARVRSESDQKMSVFMHLMGMEDISGYVDREGKRIRAGKWLELHGDPEYQSLKLAIVQYGEELDSLVVSTAWFGLKIRGRGEVLGFQTAVVGGPEEVGGATKEYAGEEEARVGHEEIVEWVLGRVPGSWVLDQK